MSDKFALQLSDKTGKVDKLLHIELVHQLGSRINFSICRASFDAANDFGWRVEAPWDDMHLSATLFKQNSMKTGGFLSLSFMDCNIPQCCPNAGDAVVSQTWR